MTVVMQAVQPVLDAPQVPPDQQLPPGVGAFFGFGMPGLPLGLPSFPGGFPGLEGQGEEGQMNEEDRQFMEDLRKQMEAEAKSYARPERLGPILAPPIISMDDHNRVWLLFGTGRIPRATECSRVGSVSGVGVKGPVLSGLCIERSLTSCVVADVLDVSGATVCTVCHGQPEVSNLPETSRIAGKTVDGIERFLRHKDGWFVNLPAEHSVLMTPMLVARTLLVRSVSSSEQSRQDLYALYYLTGTPHPHPMIGTDPDPPRTHSRPAVSLRSKGITSPLAEHVAQQGSSPAGSISTGGCSGRVMLLLQFGPDTLKQVCITSPLRPTGGYHSWLNKQPD